MVLARRFRLIIVIICLIYVVPSEVVASTYVPVGDDAYNLLFRLEAEGLIKSGLLDTLPISREEMRRLIREAEWNAKRESHLSKEDEQDIQLLKERFKEERFEDQQGKVKYIRPLDEVYTRFVYATANPSENGLNYSRAANPNGFVYNNNGDIYKKNSNFRLGSVSLADLGWFSFYINPEYRYSGSSRLTLKRIYGVLSALGLDLQIGKDSQWWGPGYNGAILLSNNAEPFTMIKLTNDHPAILPWIFKYLGLSKFTFFVTRLGSDSVPPNPYLWGLRFDLKPVSYLEIGLERTAILGGQGRSESLGTWWNSFTGQGENVAGEEAGDQRAGGDIKVTLPFSFQPVQMYLEADGEDQCGIYPCKWAGLTGVYLPRILNFNRIDFRAEYANDHVTGYPNAWYTHHIFLTGYTYPADKGLIIGHHMGTDSNDLFLKADYMVPEIQGRIYLSYDREKHNLSGSPQPIQNAATLGIYLYTKKNISLNGEYTFGKISDTPRGDLDINLFTLGISRYF